MAQGSNRSAWQRLLQWWGPTAHLVSPGEQLAALFGVALGLGITVAVAHWALPASGAPPLIASFGASAVLVFAMPHGPLSQPWPLVGGQLGSAAIGMACAQVFGSSLWVGVLAVALALGLMHLLRCFHPPGGATALTAVIGGEAIHALGFQWVLWPVALNAVCLLLVAVVFNYPLRWRRYPAAWTSAVAPLRPAQAPTLDHERLLAALRAIDGYIDISEHDLLRIYALATAPPPTAPPPAISPGRYYSNGRFGADWAVREVLAIEPGGADLAEQVRFRGVAGHCRRRIARCSLSEFRRWAAHEVVRDENSWRPVYPAA